MTVKKAVLRALLGFPLGVCISLIIVLSASAAFGDGLVYIADPEFIQLAGSELSAAVIQFTMGGVLGMSFALGSCFFEVERWSMTRQTVFHFLLTFCTIMPIAWFGRWMDHSLKGALIYAVTFIILYVIIWIIQRIIWRKRIREMNESLKQ